MSKRQPRKTLTEKKAENKGKVKPISKYDQKKLDRIKKAKKK